MSRKRKNNNCVICGKQMDGNHSMTCSVECRNIRRSRLAKEQRHLQGRRRRLPSSQLHFVVVDPGISDWRRGTAFPLIEGNYMLQYGCWTPGMVIRKHSQEYRVIGAEGARQELVKL